MNNSKQNEIFSIIENNKKILKSKELSFPEDEATKSFKITLNTYKNQEFQSIKIPKNKDLVAGQYEGGIKIWE